jgi:hypothetical protein
MISQACTPMGFVAVTVAASAVGFSSVVVTATTNFTVPPGSNLALLVAETGNVRWRDDGISPTPTSGMLMQTSQPPLEYSGDLNAIQFVAVSGTVQIDASLYKVAG